MGRQVVVTWNGEPIGVFGIRGRRGVHVGPGEREDFVLPVPPRVVEQDGETAIDHRFAVHIATTDDVALPPSPRRFGRGLAFVALSALLHGAVLASFVVSSRLAHSHPEADAAARLTAMREYLARTPREGDTGTDEPVAQGHGRSFREDEHEAAVVPPSPIAPAVPTPPTPHAATTTRATTAMPAAPVHHPRRGLGKPVPAASAPASTGVGVSAHDVGDASDGAGTPRLSTLPRPPVKLSLQAGDAFFGFWRCGSEEEPATLDVLTAAGNQVWANLFFYFGRLAQAEYLVHGTVDPATGEATLVPDESTGVDPYPYFDASGLHGRFDRGNDVGQPQHFLGAMANPRCDVEVEFFMRIMTHRGD
jgi:hypothetical protein